MRFDTPIYFQTIKTKYDASTGNYVESVESEVKRYASVTDAGDETLNLIYGEIKQGAKVIRLQNQHKEPFDRIKIGEKVYRVDRARELRVKQVFVVSEVQ